MLRKTIFWLHLSCGVLAGLVVLMMSVTGFILTYERQMQAWEDHSYYAEPGPNQQRMSVDQLLAASRQIENFEPTSILLNSNETAPVILRQDRTQTHYLNPYTGQVYLPHPDTLSRFFSVVRAWHRWFNVSGEGRSSARAITGAANLLFLFLVLSGIYLWLPKIFAWATVRIRVWFNPATSNASARDYNWHHVFGFWAAIPLVVMIATATVFNYSWANNLIYRLAGEEPPAGNTAAANNSQPATVNPVPLNDLLLTTATYSTNWQTLSLSIPEETAPTAIITIDEGDGGQPQKRHSLTFDRASGQVLDWAPFTSQTAGRQARRWVRFLHTGEALGLPGQTIAGLASFAAIIMVWTGLALTLRRFLRWLARLQRVRELEIAST